MSDERPAANQPARGWRRHGVNEPPSLLNQGLDARQSKRRRTLFLVLAGCVAVTGAIIGWFLLPHGYTEPYFLTTPFTEYVEPQLPITAWATEDSTALRMHFPNSRKEFNFQEAHLLRQTLQTVGTQAKPIVVHLRAHALTRGDQVYLLPSDTRFNDLENFWQPLEHVIKTLREGPSKERLLLLDLMRPLADPYLGILADDVADKVDAYLREELKKSDEPALWVLTACGPGQVSLVSEELGQSVFGHYLTEGLHGRADGWGPKNEENSRVSVKELARFVEDHVSHWARRNRGVEQRPVLHGRGNDFDLVTLVRRPLQRIDPPELDTYPAWLRKGWEARDEAWGKSAHLLAPLALQQFETALLRAEQRWRGEAFATVPGRLQKIQNDVSLARQRLDKQLRQSSLPAPRDVSLAWARKLSKEPEKETDAGLLKELSALVAQRLQAVKLAEPKEREKLSQAVDKGKQDLIEKYRGQSFELGRAVFAAAEEAPFPETILFLGQLVGEVKPPLEYSEVRFLSRLAETLTARRRKSEDQFKQVKADLVQAALRSTRRAHEAAACEPEVLPWIQKAFEEAATKRQKGLELFAKEGPSRWEQAAKLLQDAQGEFDELAKANEHLRTAYARRDWGLATLPRVLPYLLAQRSPDPRVLQAWDELVKSIQQVDDLLAKRNWQEAVAVASAAGELRRHYRVLRQSLEEEQVAQLKKRSETEEPVRLLTELEALLASPWLTAKARVEVWQLLRSLAKSLHDDTLTAELRRTLRPESVGSPRPEQERAALRAKLLLDLLSVARAPEAANLRVEIKKLPADAEVAAWLEYGEKLGKAWRTLAVPPQLEAASRLHRLLPLSANDLTETRGNPAGLLRQRAAENYWSWLEGWRREEGTDP